MDGPLNASLLSVCKFHKFILCTTFSKGLILILISAEARLSESLKGWRNLQVSGTLFFLQQLHTSFFSFVQVCLHRLHTSSKCANRSVCFLGPTLPACMPLLVQMNGATQAVGANFSNYQATPNAFTTMPIISKSHN